MRRIRHATCFVLSVAAIAAWMLWLVTEVGSWHFSNVQRDWYHVLCLRNGSCWYQYRTPESLWQVPVQPRECKARLPWVGCVQVVTRGNYRRVDVSLHLFGVVCLLGPYPLCVLVRGPIRRGIRRRRGCCAWCGYDLTGNVSGVCPECGMRIASRASDGQP